LKKKVLVKGSGDAPTSGSKVFGEQIGHTVPHCFLLVHLYSCSSLRRNSFEWREVRLEQGSKPVFRI
jgi:hypothetical protein